jgi:hypothetical protein
MRKWHIGAALTIMTAMSAGSIMAQAPGGAGAAGAQPRPDRAARPARPAPADGGIARLLPTGATIVVANVANGVELTATVEDAERVQALQAQLTRTVERMTQMVERMGDRARNFQMPGIYGLLMKGKVTLATANLDNGATLTFTSEDAETLKALQTDMPKWVEAATAAQAQLDARRKMTALLKDGKVTIEIVEGETGVDVKFTTEDPAALTTLKAIMPAYIEGLKNPAPTGYMGGRTGGRGGNRGGDRGNRGGGDRGNRGGAGERAFPEPKPADK